MEVIVQYHFDTSDGERIQAALRYDDQSKMVIYTYTGRPDLSYAKSAAWLKSKLSGQNYDMLHPVNKALLDFLNARLIEEE